MQHLDRGTTHVMVRITERAIGTRVMPGRIVTGRCGARTPARGAGLFYMMAAGVVAIMSMGWGWVKMLETVVIATFEFGDMAAILPAGVEELSDWLEKQRRDEKRYPEAPPERVGRESPLHPASGFHRGFSPWFSAECARPDYSASIFPPTIGLGGGPASTRKAIPLCYIPRIGFHRLRTCEEPSEPGSRDPLGIIVDVLTSVTEGNTSIHARPLLPHPSLPGE